VKPLILDYAVDRKHEGDLIFSYDNTLNLNVVKNNQKISPYVDVSNSSLELATITKVKGEGNDISYSMLELVTKTDVVRERDDQRQDVFLEFMTNST
jgi:hypothetical protein